ncbi:2-keto-3-deoxy-L-rhamnonate aldolase [Venustampulla echinocandica]|uniref:2-keto-3-deoxy-L-rhamnonate aldolase n=1 Tax=Venustampulla echinocandica TaxID=2656787 RepID=A0A370T9T3_9HELO|nr:2-keto-3-deoxy-L-rhamnonate aldolase [Venustampulla echinocandica]RDL30419.1 2-keto-3-deoxy-L-rhamnonate aldolase [Venustampulla echinocandica]
MASFDNVLLTKASAGWLCKALGIRLVTNPLVVQLAKNAGFDALFIDLEHSTFSLADASAIACAGLLSGLTPFVRVPYQCGIGFVQQVLDGGGMGVIFPHIHSAVDARVAVEACKFPPWGRRSMWGQQPALGLRMMPFNKIVEVCDSVGSSVLLMIEAADSIENIDSIAAVDGVDVLLVGCLDLSTDMGMPGKYEARAFRAALESVSAACQRHGRLMGLAGLYNNPEIQDWAINTLKVRFIMCQQDSNILAAGAIECAAEVSSVDRTAPMPSKVVNGAVKETKVPATANGI